MIVDKDSSDLGVMPIEVALKKAEEMNLDLVEVSPKSTPPVCRLMDFGHFLYHQKKIDQAQKKKQKKTEIKGIRIGFRISDHDLGIKEKQGRKFLERGCLIKLTMIFKGREISYSKFGMEKLVEFAEKLSDISEIEQNIKRQGNQISLIVKPTQKK